MPTQSAVLPFQKLKPNQSVAELVEEAVRVGEVKLTDSGVLVAETGAHTGRSPKDKFVVRDETTIDQVWWGNNSSMTPEQFEILLRDFHAHMATLPKLYSQDLFAGADGHHRIGVSVTTELAWHSLFIRNLLIRPKEQDRQTFSSDLTIINLPSFKADPLRHGCRSETVIACNLKEKIILIGGTAYAGETKKAVFTYLNYIYPAQDILPMHCSANVGVNEDVALFFGLSGTGKTTLSTDAVRRLIGDDEHGWSNDGIFNFEGGCYAKTIRLSHETEPEIFAASRRFGTVLENVGLKQGSRYPDYGDASRTENTRAAYPIESIANADLTGRGSHPKNIIMLSCDAFGVLPPLAQLNADQAVQYFLVGYTAKVAGTERGVTEPEATFSACFGAPFMPRQPQVYGRLLGKLIAQHRVTCWLVNTGWVGGPPGVGQRMPLASTRMLVNAALGGKVKAEVLRQEPYFKLLVPTEVEGVASHLLVPKQCWPNELEYARAAQLLRDKFDQAIARVNG
jgi:phosphoenolpyruvate carboxykinase (ATP)